MTRIKNLSRLLDLTVIQIVRTVRITHATIFLYNKDKNIYELKASRGKSKKEIGTELNPNNILVKSLFIVRTTLAYDEIDKYVKKIKARGMLISASDIGDLRLLMKQLDAAVCIPAFIEDELIAFLVLGEKQSAEIYTQEDLDTFTTLINQAALAIDHALAYEELVHTRDQLVKVEKLATMGEFATEVAHEIKNPLQAIKAFSELINEKYKDKEFREKFSKLVTAEVDRIDNFVRQLVKVAHPLPPKLDIVDINELLTSVLELMENDLANNNISVKKQYDINPVRIQADKDQLKQVFLNIITNAIDAMKNSRNRLLTVSTFSIQSNAIVKIADTGCGIPPDSISRLFNPLFTTKEKGSGLGLSIVDTIIKNHKGKLDVESKIGEGTTFIISI